MMISRIIVIYSSSQVHQPVQPGDSELAEERRSGRPTGEPEQLLHLQHIRERLPQPVREGQADLFARSHAWNTTAKGLSFTKGLNSHKVYLGTRFHYMLLRHS